MTPRVAAWGLGAIGAVAVVEWAAAAWAYRDRIDADDWSALGAALEGVSEPVVLGTRWLGPSARRDVPALRGAEPPDLVDAPTFTVVRLGGFGDPDLDLELAGPLERAERTTVGPFVVDRMRQAEASTRLARFGVDGPLQVFLGDEACKGRGPWRCKAASVEAQFVEIDYRARWCLTVEAGDGATVRLRAPGFPLGQRLRGHVGFSDFNGRLRSDAPATVTIAVGDATVARFVVTDAQGWHPFEVATDPGSADVEIRVLQTALGTFGTDGYAHRPARPVCLELRSLGPGGPS